MHGRSSPTRSRGRAGAGGASRSPARKAKGKGKGRTAKTQGRSASPSKRDNFLSNLVAGKEEPSDADSDESDADARGRGRGRKGKKIRSRSKGRHKKKAEPPPEIKKIDVSACAAPVCAVCGRMCVSAMSPCVLTDRATGTPRAPAHPPLHPRRAQYVALWDKAVASLPAARPIKKKLEDLSLYASQHVDFSDCGLRVKEVEIVAAGLPELHMLTIFGASIISLNMSNCSLSANAAKALAYGLEENRTLKKLWLNTNPLGPEGVRHVALCLRHNTSLMSLNISSTEMTKGDWLKNNEYDHPVYDTDYRGVEALSDMLCANKTLTRLNLAKNNLKAEGLEFLVPALRDHPSLRSCSLAMNNPPPASMIYLGRILRDNTAMRKLDLRGTALKSRGCKLLCEGLRGNFSITVLNLRNCGITADLLFEHFGPLFKTSTIRKLDLSFNNVGSNGCHTMSEVIEVASMTSLDMSSTSATDNGVELGGVLALMEAVSVNHNLVDLSLSHNSLVLTNFRGHDTRDDDYSCIDALAAAMRTNRTLVNIDVSENGIKMRGQRVLRDALVAQPRGIRWALDVKEVLDAWLQRYLSKRDATTRTAYPRVTLKWARIRLIQFVFEALEETRQVMY